MKIAFIIQQDEQGETWSTKISTCKTGIKQRRVYLPFYFFIQRPQNMAANRVTSVCPSTCPHVKIPLISESMHTYWVAGLSD